MLACFLMIVATIKNFFFAKAKPHISIISKNHNILKTPFKGLNFSFTVESLSNLNRYQRDRGYEKAGKKLYSRLSLKTIRFKIAG